MGILSRLFSSPKKPRVDDAAFGPIVYSDDSWVFTPPDANSGPMLIVEAGPAGPSDLQRAFYRQLQERLPALCAASTTFIRQHESSYASRSFDLYSITVPTEPELDQDSFVLEFASDPDATVIHRVEFAAGIPETYGEDD